MIYIYNMIYIVSSTTATTASTKTTTWYIIKDNNIIIAGPVQIVSILSTELPA